MAGEELVERILISIDCVINGWLRSMQPKNKKHFFQLRTAPNGNQPRMRAIWQCACGFNGFRKDNDYYNNHITSCAVAQLMKSLGKYHTTFFRADNWPWFDGHPEAQFMDRWR
jgi:hypothetical protein